MKDVPRLRDSELKIMNELWESGNMPARLLYRIMTAKIGWNKNTTYTMINQCVQKGFIERIEPNFVCKPLVTKEEIQRQRVFELIGKLFNDSKKVFFNAFLNEKNLTQEEIAELKDVVNKLK